MVAGVGAVREGLNRDGAAGGEPKSSRQFFGDAGELAPSSCSHEERSASSSPASPEPGSPGTADSGVSPGRLGLAWTCFKFRAMQAAQ